MYLRLDSFSFIGLGDALPAENKGEWPEESQTQYADHLPG